MNRAQLLACPECDLLQHDAPAPRPRKALCARCGAVLYQRRDGGLERILALTVTALVLLAPACASFDWFRDYAERGSVFKEEVDRLGRSGVRGRE